MTTNDERDDALGQENGERVAKGPDMDKSVVTREKDEVLQKILEVAEAWITIAQRSTSFTGPDTAQVIASTNTAPPSRPELQMGRRPRTGRRSRPPARFQT